MQYRAMQLAYFNDRLVQPGDIVESDEDLADSLAPANPANPMELSPVYELVCDECAT
jgi:hypothetical protein